jgi:serine/threonine-protein kinase
MAEAGATLGGYRLLSLLAKGGMGEVWEAERGGSRVALKLLPASADATNRRQFLEEARLGAQLQHPNIVRVIDSGLTAEAPYLVMELLQGLPLSHLMRSKRKLPVGLVLGLAGQALAGLEAAHAATGADGKPLNLVHRDIKPSNLFLTETGQLKLIDFGIAKVAMGAVTTTTGHVRGTPQYFSPEQAGALPVIASSDLFSLALVLEELLIGQPVLNTESMAAAVGQLLYGVLPPVSEFRDDLPPALSHFLSCCLSRTSPPRPRSAEQMAKGLLEASAREKPWTQAQLAEWLAGARRDVARQAPGTVERVPVLTAAPPGLQPQSQRRRWPLALLAAGALGGVGALARVYLTAPPPPHEVAPLVPTLDSAAPEPTPAEPSTPELTPAEAAPVEAPAKARPSPPGYLTIDTEPYWAEVWVRSKKSTTPSRKLGVTPLVHESVSPGVYEVELRQQDGERTFRQVRVPSQQEVRLKVQLGR